MPPYVAVNRDEEGNLLPDCCFEEHDDSIVVNGVTLNKTFVEKPVSGEDHNINIYYPISMGGGSKSLFRKKARIPLPTLPIPPTHPPRQLSAKERDGWRAR